MKKEKALENILLKAWDKKTCYPVLQSKWKENRPEIGQCAVTALITQDFFGGSIVYNQTYDHFWNILPTGKSLDLTKSQFPKNIVLKPHNQVDRKVILTSEEAKKQKTSKRYKLLKARVTQILNNHDLLLK